VYKFVGQVSHKHVSISIGGPFNSIYFYNTWGHVSIGEVSISQKSAEVFRGRSLVGASRGVLGLAGAATLHHHVVLSGEGDGSQGQHQEQVGRVGLPARTVDHVACSGRALMEDDLLQQVRKSLHYRHPLPRGEGGAPHGGRCVELRRAELRGGGGAAAGSGVDGAAGGGSRCSCTRCSPGAGEAGQTLQHFGIRGHAATVLVAVGLVLLRPHQQVGDRCRVEGGREERPPPRQAPVRPPKLPVAVHALYQVSRVERAPRVGQAGVVSEGVPPKVARLGGRQRDQEEHQQHHFVIIL